MDGSLPVSKKRELPFDMWTVTTTKDRPREADTISGRRCWVTEKNRLLTWLGYLRLRRGILHKLPSR